MTNRVTVCAVFDSAVQAYQQPIFVKAIGAAMRMFTDEVNRAAADNAFNKHPEDFALWYLCDYFEDTGEFSPDAQGKRLLARGQDLIKEQQP